MDTPEKSSLETLIETTQAYSKTTLELTKLKGLKSIANVISVIVARLCLVITVFVSLIIISIGGALWLNDILAKPYYGFFILGGFYLLIAIVLYFFLPTWIKKPFGNLIISEALD